MPESDERNDTFEKLEVPEFLSHGLIPEELADEWQGIPKPQRVMIRRQMVSDMKLDWCIQRLANGHDAIAVLKRDVQTLNRLKEIIFAKWSLVVAIVTIFFVPALLVWYGNYLAHNSVSSDPTLTSILNKLIEQTKPADQPKPKP